MKKITSLVLAVMMLISVMTVGIVSVRAETNITYNPVQGSDNTCDSLYWVCRFFDTNGSRCILSQTSVDAIKQIYKQQRSCESTEPNMENIEFAAMKKITNNYISIGSFSSLESYLTTYVPIIFRGSSIKRINCKLYEYEPYSFYFLPIGTTTEGNNTFTYTAPILNDELITDKNDIAVNKLSAGTDWSIKKVSQNNDVSIAIVDVYLDNYVQPVPENEITVSGNTGISTVTLTTETSNLRVTVPSVLPISVDTDNNITVATNAVIQNNSNGQVDVTNAVINTSTWSVVDFDTDFTAVPVDTKQYSLKLNNDDVSDGIDVSVFGTIDGQSSVAVNYDANVAIQSTAINAEEIGNIVFTVAWHK